MHQRTLSVPWCTRLVVATVIGHRSDGLVIDASALALLLDRSTASQPVDMGYGVICDVDGAPHRNMVVDRVTQEHGVVVTRTRLEIGTVVRILPNHAFITAAAHPGYKVVIGNRVLDRWERVNGW